MTSDRTSRRDFVRTALGGLVALPMLAACRPGDAPLCGDVSELSAGERDARLVTLGYELKSPNPSETCAGCVQFTPPSSDACGRCQIVRGPIDPRGRCKRWIARSGSR
jgi:hypothetical protein